MLLASSLAHSELTLVLTFHREVSDKLSPATHINYCSGLGQILGHSSLCVRGRRQPDSSSLAISREDACCLCSKVGRPCFPPRSLT